MQQHLSQVEERMVLLEAENRTLKGKSLADLRDIVMISFFVQNGLKHRESQFR